jgi:DNA-binding transcriptional LysR family regulator
LAPTLGVVVSGTTAYVAAGHPISENALSDMDLNSLALFAKVVKASSFSAAARHLSMPIATVSRRVAELEDQLGVCLLERSTRSLRLTGVGSEILEQARRATAIREEINGIVSNHKSVVSGVLRLCAPPTIDSLIAPLVCAFQACYPHVRVHVRITGQVIDAVADEIDLAFRWGALEDSSLIARRILTYRHRLVASPSYFETREQPNRPHDLLAHPLITFAQAPRENHWGFVNVDGGEEESVSFLPHLSMNDSGSLAPALLSGAGIGDLPPLVQPHLLHSGELVEVMPRWRFRAMDLWLLHQGGRHVPPAIRLFKDLAAQMAPTLFPVLPT